MRNKPTDHEEFCKRHFDAWLGRAGAASRHWERGSDPPDFILTLEGVRYSVEVSRIINGEHITSSASLNQLMDDLQRELLAKESIGGTYIVDPDAPLPAGKRYRREFRERIAAFITATRFASRTIPETVKIAGRQIARIEKHSASGTQLFCNGIGGGGWEDEIRREYENVTNSLLKRKRTLLARHSPAILILQDALCPISPRILPEVIRATPESSAFEAIYVIRTELTGDVAANRPSWPARYRHNLPEFEEAG